MRKPKIAFIHPPLSLYQRYGILGNVLGRLQPGNLCYLAAATRQDGFETEIIDSQALNLGIKDTAEGIVESSPEYVGITATTCSIHSAGLLAQLIKQSRPDIITIIGGAHLSALPEETMSAFKDFDVGVIGEGERTIVELLRAYEDNSDLKKIKGIVFRKNGNLIVSPPREFIDNIDSLPMPAWDLLPDFRYYSPNLSSLRRLPAACLVTSRGCYKGCIFCDKSVFGNSTRSHSPKYIIEAVSYLHNNYNVKEIVFKDPDFAFSKNRVMQICKLLKAEGLRIGWSCMLRADSIDKEILSEMRNAGCWQVCIGIESGSQKVLDSLKKCIKLEMIESAINLLNKYKFNIIGFFMIGSPHETEHTIWETRRFIRKIRIDNIKVNFFTPYPGISAYKEMRKFGDFGEDWSKLNGAYPVFVPFVFNEARLRYFSKKMLREFYFRPGIIMNYLMKTINPRIILKFLAGMLSLVRYIFSKNE